MKPLSERDENKGVAPKSTYSTWGSRNEATLWKRWELPRDFSGNSVNVPVVGMKPLSERDENNIEYL